LLNAIFILVYLNNFVMNLFLFLYTLGGPFLSLRSYIVRCITGYRNVLGWIYCSIVIFYGNLVNTAQRCLLLSFRDRVLVKSVTKET
jgi:hypothetical protein